MKDEGVSETNQRFPHCELRHNLEVRFVVAERQYDYPSMFWVRILQVI
jgi:hypothetical protein